MNFIKNSISIGLVFACAVASAQETDLSSLMNDATKAEKEYTTATFKGTKILNSHSIEGCAKGVLQVNFQHRFGTLNNGIEDFFGLDQASIRFGFDYGISDRLTTGVGRSTMQKAYDGYLKYKIIRQASGPNAMPITMTLLATTAINTLKRDWWLDPSLNDDLGYRMYYTTQLIIARKFSPSISFQIMPTFVHRNLTEFSDEKNSIFSMGFAGRVKLTKRFGIVAESYFTPSNQLGSSYHNIVAGIGLEIETGGHVYHLLFTNSEGMIEHQLVGMTRNSVSDGLKGIRFGFNLSRVFTIVKPKI